MKVENVTVHLGERSYSVVIGYNILPQIGDLIRQKTRLTYSSAVILTNQIVRSLMGKVLEKSLQKARIASLFLTLPDTERSKSLFQYGEILKQLTEISKGGKSFFLINLGGGVVGDIGGFVAATFKRGIPYLHVPTTLLAQVDSAIGGKTGIDLPSTKNGVGAIWQPVLVVSDVKALSTLPQREFISGMAEVIKYGVIADEKLFCFLERFEPEQIQKDPEVLKHLVATCSRLKAKFVEQDERDQLGKRAFLNFGHTIGHAIESATGYSNLYKHGEAVSIGMVCAARISALLGLSTLKLSERLTLLLKKMSLPIQLDTKVSVETIFKNYLFDKKFLNSKTRFVLPIKMGQPLLVEGISQKIVQRVVSSCRL